MRYLICRGNEKLAETNGSHDEAIRQAKEIVSHAPIVHGLIAPLLIWDDLWFVWVTALTDDANGVTVHQLMKTNEV